MSRRSAQNNRPQPEDDQEFSRVSQQYEQRKFWRKHPKTGSQIINQLFAKKGYNQTSSTASVDKRWQQVVGDSLGTRSKPGILRRGVLEIIVQNSSVMQELVFQKSKILKKFKADKETSEIVDLKFKIGAT